MVTKVKERVEVDPLSVLGDALKSAAETWGDATANPRESAKAAARKVKDSAGTGVYKSAYGLSYGIVFSAVFLKELLPESSLVRRGFEEGAESAKAAVVRRKAGSDEGDEETPTRVLKRKASAATKRAAPKVKTTRKRAAE